MKFVFNMISCFSTTKETLIKKKNGFAEKGDITSKKLVE